MLTSHNYVVHPRVYRLYPYVDIFIFSPTFQLDYYHLRDVEKASWYSYFSLTCKCIGVRSSYYLVFVRACMYAMLCEYIDSL